MTAPVVRLWPRAVARAEHEAHARNDHPSRPEGRPKPAREPVKPAAGQWVPRILKGGGE